MKSENRLAKIERRLEELQFLFLDPLEQLKRLERGDSPIDEGLRRISSKLFDLECRLDKSHPPSLQFQLQLLKEKMERLQTAQTELEQRFKAVQTSTKRKRFRLTATAK